MFGKKLFTGIIFTINIIAVLSLLLSLLSAVVSPDKFIYLSYFSLFFTIIACINVLFVFFWIIVRRWLFLVSLVALILVYKPISENFAFNFREKTVENTEPSFSILTYNTHMMYWMVKSRGNPIVSHILNADADIVCLQEFATSMKKEFLSEKEVIELLKKYPYHHIEYKIIKYNGTMNSGNAVFSKYPIVTRGRVKYNTKGNISTLTDIVISEKDTIRLINNHLESNFINDLQRQKISNLPYNFYADSLKSATKYLSGQLKASYRLRAKQADVIAQIVSDSPYKTVVCGDFNDVPGSYVYSKIKGNLKDVFTEKGFGLGWTYNSSVFKIRIDYILCHKDFTVSEYNVKKVKYSDHYPIFCRIKL